MIGTGQEQFELGGSGFLYSCSSRGRKWRTKNCKRWEHDWQETRINKDLETL